MKKFIIIICFVCMYNLAFSQNGSGLFEGQGFLGYLSSSSIIFPPGQDEIKIATSLPNGRYPLGVEAPEFAKWVNSGSSVVLSFKKRQLAIWNDGYEGQKVEFIVKVIVERGKSGGDVRPWMESYWDKYYVWKIYWQS